MNRWLWSAAGMMGLVWGALGCTGEAPEESGAEEEPGTSQDALSVHRYGWAALVHDQNFDFSRSYSSTGGSITQTYLDGLRTVTFWGFPYTPTTNVQISSNYSNGTRACTLVAPPTGNSSSTSVTVACFAGYSGSDSSDGSAEMTVALDSNPGTSASPNRGAFLMTTGGTTPTVTNSWSSSGATSTVTWNPTSQWFEVSLPGLGFENAGVHVTAMGAGSRRCKVVSWGSGVVRVRCYKDNPATFEIDYGPTSDSGFSLSYQETSQIPGDIGGHAWVSNGNISTSYAAALSVSGPCGTPPSVLYQGVGTNTSEVYFPNSSWTWPTQVNVPMVTAYGSSSDFCTVSQWFPDGNGTRVRVLCVQESAFDIRPANESKFTLSLSSWGEFKLCP